MTDNILTQALLKEHLHYEPETGVFTWIKKTSIKSNNIKIGRLAATKMNNGYLAVQIFNKSYLSHRLAWLYVYGKLSENEIDHINGLKTDNRIVNLRICNHGENLQNLTLLKNNSSGFAGVSFHKHRGRWQAKIRYNKKDYYLGLYNTPEEAHQAYVIAKAKYHTFNPVLRES